MKERNGKMSNKKVIVNSMRGCSREFDGDSVRPVSDGGVEVLKNGKVVALAYPIRHGDNISHAYVVTEKKKRWKIKFVKE